MYWLKSELKTLAQEWATMKGVEDPIDTWQLGTVDASVKLPHAQAALAQQIRADRPMLANSDVMKQRVREALPKHEYNVADFYHKTGIWRVIAKHPFFENLTLVVICINALWIAIDTDNNPTSTLLDAQPIFQIADHFFCWYFSFEWYVRFSAFKKKRHGLKDRWFVFDSCLVFMMVAETWAMSIALLCLDAGRGSGVGGASILRLFRLLRLSRLARMLRSMPELMILIKGMFAASRSVFFTICLMGVFLDNLGHTADTIAESSPVVAVVFFIFVVCAALMVMNIQLPAARRRVLIGVLCEVVSAVASTEKEMDVYALKSKLAEVMHRLDTNGNGTLSEEEFVQLVGNPKVATLLGEVGVDAIGLIDMAPSIFDPEDEEDEDDDDDEGASRPPKEISFTDFVKIVLDLRGSNAASLKDLRELKHDLVSEIESLKVRLNVSRRRSSIPRHGGLSRRPSAALAPEECVLGPGTQAQGTPSECLLPAGGGEARGDAGLQEVEGALRAWQAALARVQRPALPGAARPSHEEEVLEWIDSMSTTAASELERLQRMHRS
ncbi:unnamed protein product [Prorocentrum cordatum]|uniref:EF-hand domain-containing protein n=1 Tax=Prorocentrum cordatum TaxID=2364126 RepID=A0ABN9VM30_9DINO|nr:unnamed protein product [Polarella glacialis]